MCIRDRVGYVSEQEQEAAAARQRFVAAFNQELLGKPEDGLIGAEGTVNVEAMNRALYEQVQVAGASAATLALLGVATGQFSEEQAEAALKAAIDVYKRQVIWRAIPDKDKTRRSSRR